MKLQIPALLAILAAPHLGLAKCPPQNPDGLKAGDELRDFFTNAVEEFFPDKKGWEKAYEKYWSPDLKATFNATEYDFDGFKEFLATVAYPLMTEGFKGTFQHGFRDVVAVPLLGTVRGGFVTATGWEAGLRHGDPDLPYNRTNGAFAFATENKHCKLQFTEWRETSNLGKI